MSNISHKVLHGNLFLRKIVSMILFVRTAKSSFLLEPSLSLFPGDVLQCNWIISISLHPYYLFVFRNLYYIILLIGLELREFPFASMNNFAIFPLIVSLNG
ncbi:unnamed protein product [Citrullus colocynthis]|uniref:Uncharacterized protein n=1 Tax=Citrullus colocynthis TaxID=252529 RepID=A0ABP0Z7B7_9ROSI